MHLTLYVCSSFLPNLSLANETGDRTGGLSIDCGFAEIDEVIVNRAPYYLRWIAILVAHQAFRVHFINVREQVNEYQI